MPFVLCRFVVVAAAVALGSGCVAAADDPFEIEPGGKQDGGFPVIEADLGASLADLEVRATGDDRDRLVLVRIKMNAGDSLVAAMRASSAGLDSYLLLKDRDGETVADRDVQALLPMAAEDDAVVAYTAAVDGPVFLFAAGGPDLQTGGRFDLELVGLSAPPKVDLSITHGGLRAVAAELRAREPVLTDDLARRALIERADGFVEIGAGFAELPLAERAEVRRHESAINELRQVLFEEYARTSDAASAGAVGAAAAEVWAQVRR